MSHRHEAPSAPVRRCAPSGDGARVAHDPRRYQPIARLAAAVCAAPVAGVSFPGPDGFEVQASVGVPAGSPSIPRTVAPCHLVVATGRPRLVLDAAVDPDLAGGAFVEGLGLRFYAGVPIEDLGGAVIGTVWVAAPEPRRALPVEHLRALEDLAAEVALSVNGSVLQTMTLLARAERDRRRYDAHAGILRRIATDAGLAGTLELVRTSVEDLLPGVRCSVRVGPPAAAAVSSPTGVPRSVPVVVDGEPVAALDLTLGADAVGADLDGVVELAELAAVAIGRERAMVELRRRLAPAPATC